jgi:hypothetical protein
VTPNDPVIEELGRHANDLGTIKAKVERLEEAQKPNQIDAAVERGLPADWTRAEEATWRKFTPFRSRWPELTELDRRVAELEARRGEVHAELNHLRDREQAAPAAHSAALAAWIADGEKGPRPESELPKIKQEIEEREADYHALQVVVGRTLDEKVAFVQRHRKRLVGEADEHVEQTYQRYLAQIAELLETREQLGVDRRHAVWARIYPGAEAMVEPPATVCGGNPKPLRQAGLSQSMAPAQLAALLRADAEWLRHALTREQQARITNTDPRLLDSDTRWVDTPEEKARRAQRTHEWAQRRGR